MPPRNESTRAVDRIEYPPIAGRTLALTVFFSQDAILGPLACEKLANGLFGAAVRFGDRVEISLALLVRHVDALAEQRPDHLPGGICQFMGQGDKFGRNGHGASLA